MRVVVQRLRNVPYRETYEVLSSIEMNTFERTLLSTARALIGPDYQQVEFFGVGPRQTDCIRVETLAGYELFRWTIEDERAVRNGAGVAIH